MIKKIIAGYNVAARNRKIITWRCDDLRRADQDRQIFLTEHFLARGIDEKMTYILRELDLWSSPEAYGCNFKLREFPPVWIAKGGVYNLLDQRILPGIFGLRLIDHALSQPFEATYRAIRHELINLQIQISTKGEIARMTKTEKRLLHIGIASRNRPLLAELASEINRTLVTPPLLYYPRAQGGKADDFKLPVLSGRQKMTT